MAPRRGSEGPLKLFFIYLSENQLRVWAVVLCYSSSVHHVLPRCLAATCRKPAKWIHVQFIIVKTYQDLGRGAFESTLSFVLCTEYCAKCLCQVCRIDTLRTGGAFILPSYLTCSPPQHKQRPKRCAQKSRMSTFWLVTANELLRVWWWWWWWRVELSKC